MNNSATYLDTLYQVETPEGINLTFRPASAVIRSLAFIIDLLCQGGILFLMLFLFQFVGFAVGFMTYIGVMLLLYFVINWWYFVLFEVLRNGQSIGKKMFNLQVIHDDGTPISWNASLLRNLLRVVDLLPGITYAVGLLCSINHSSFKRLGDIAAGTLVVYYQSNIDRDKMATNLPALPAEPPPFILSAEERAVIISFAIRHNDFSEQRRLEMASLLNDTFKTSSHESEQKIYAMARYLLGGEGIKSADQDKNEL